MSVPTGLTTADQNLEKENKENYATKVAATDSTIREATKEAIAKAHQAAHLKQQQKEQEALDETGSIRHTRTVEDEAGPEDVKHLKSSDVDNIPKELRRLIQEYKEDVAQLQVDIKHFNQKTTAKFNEQQDMLYTHAQNLMHEEDHLSQEGHNKDSIVATYKSSIKHAVGQRFANATVNQRQTEASRHFASQLGFQLSQQQELPECLNPFSSLLKDMFRYMHDNGLEELFARHTRLTDQYAAIQAQLGNNHAIVIDRVVDLGLGH